MTIQRLTIILCGLLAYAGCQKGDSGLQATGSDGSSTLSFSSVKARTHSADPVVLEDGDFRVHARATRGHATKPSNVYYATFSNPDVIIELSSYGKVEYKDQGRMVLTIESDADVAHASTILHSKGGSKCGGLRNVPLTPVTPVREESGLGLVDPGNLTRNEKVSALVGKVERQKIYDTVEKLVGFGSRYQGSTSGLQAAEWVATTGYGALLNGRTDVTVEKFTHQRTQQPSVITRIKGAKTPNKIIIVGSHLDSLNLSGANAAPGADDNASGTATLIEAFRILMAEGARFDYTIEFHAYAAEEMGLWGSEEIAAKYKADGKDVVAMVQFDMDGYVKAGETPKIWLINNLTSAALNTSLGTLIDLYVGVPHGQAPLTAGSSDHASWNRNGFQAAFPFENPAAHNPHIHSENDTMEKLDFSYAQHFSKLVLAYVSHFGGLIEEPVTQPETPPEKSKDLFAFLAESGELYLAGPAAVQRLALCKASPAACIGGSSVITDFAHLKDKDGRRYYKASAAITIEENAKATVLAYDAAGKVKWLREISFAKP